MVRIAKTVAFSSVAFALALPCLVRAQEKSAVENEASCRKFVQEFYDWYASKDRAPKVRPLDLVLKEKHAAFNAVLVKGLQDVLAEATANNDARLDFDPILNIQDPAYPYVKRSLTAREGLHD